MQALSQLSYTPFGTAEPFAQTSGLSHLSELPEHSGTNTLAEWTGLEPATPGVTGRYSNQLNYHSSFTTLLPKSWRPHGDSNPSYRRERAVS